MLENIFEKLIWRSRYIVILGVITSIVSAMLMAGLGCIDVILIFKYSATAWDSPESYESFQKIALMKTVSSVDNFLIATVLLIFGVGLYELFINKIEDAESDQKSSRLLVVHSLDELKEKLGKVIIMVLVVTFFKHAVNQKYTEPEHLLMLSLGILLVSLALYYTHAEKK